jgi:hypothetical protein
MAKGRRKEVEREVPHIVDVKGVEPNCPRCKETSFAVRQQSVDGLAGSFVYCQACGCIISWTTKQK